MDLAALEAAQAPLGPATAAAARTALEASPASALGALAAAPVAPGAVPAVLGAPVALAESPETSGILWSEVAAPRMDSVTAVDAPDRSQRWKAVMLAMDVLTNAWSRSTS